MPFHHLGASGATVPSPLVLDSPHSWRSWPADAMPTLAPPEVLDTSWDAFVDELWAHAADGQAPVLAARFHRAFIDANRARDDIDPALLAQPWPGLLRPSARSAVGMGLIRRFALPGVPMYAAPLEVDDIQARIQGLYDPYHAELDRCIQAAWHRFGIACHIDCHSMKSVGNAMNVDGGQPRPDMVVSDLSGESCAPALTDWLAGTLRTLGYRVQVNHPYRGDELIRRHGLPAQGRHSVQIEIKRGLYMDETRCLKHAGFDRLAADLRTLVQRLLQDLASGLGQALRAPSSLPSS